MASNTNIISTNSDGGRQKWSTETMASQNSRLHLHQLVGFQLQVHAELDADFGSQSYRVLNELRRWFQPLATLGTQRDKSEAE